ncbi:MAG: glycosyltransferase [Candidatus Binatia bacterium]
MNIAILHPELGIGGAERLVVDAAMALQARNHHVTLFTAHRDPQHCFPEARDGTLDVREHGRRLPLHVGGHLRAPAAIMRMLASVRAARRDSRRFDVVFCDSVAHVVPILRRALRVPIAFYCHFPDQLLTPRRRGWYRWYRRPLDRLEEIGMASADHLLVNSAFTAATVRRTFPRLALTPQVLHPGVNPEHYRAAAAAAPAACDTVLALSRYVPAKNLVLAVDAFARLRDMLPEATARARLVIAGGYDPRLAESRDTAAALRARADALRIGEQVILRHSPTDAERLALFAEARCVVYTPSREHFGYVPIEAMAAGRPVVAVGDGGPAETIDDGRTGFLRPATADDFADALRAFWIEPERASRMGRAGRARVARDFSLHGFGARLEATLAAMVTSAAARSTDRARAG